MYGSKSSTQLVLHNIRHGHNQKQQKSEKGVINVLYLGKMRTHELESYYFYWERENI